jgi:hypothetical protein
VSRDVTSIATSGALAWLLVLLAASALATWWLHRRSERPAALWFAGLASAALIAAVTLFRDGWPQGFDLRRLADWSGDGWQRLSGDPFGSSQFVLNLVLFVPAGAAWTVFTRHARRVTFVLAVGSMAIECVQAVAGLGANDVVDLAANTLGAGLGAAAATLGLWVAERRQITWTRRRQWAMVAVAATGFGLVGTAWLAGASHRQSVLLGELRAKFGATTKADVDSWLNDSDGNDADLQVFSAIPTRSDGVRTSGTATQVRWPATFFGLHRCVMVVWADQTVSFRRESGAVCTELMG